MQNQYENNGEQLQQGLEQPQEPPLNQRGMIAHPNLLSTLSPDQIRRDQRIGLHAIREFLQSKTSFDVLPVSYRVIVFETSLLVKRALNILLQNSIVSAPLWNSKTSRFAGLLTSNDFINVIQYYSQNPTQFQFIDNLTLDGLRDVEKAVGTPSLETVSIHPFKPLYDACVKMIQSSARRIPLIDEDENTHREIVVSVLTQYRILKFVSMNCKETKILLQPLHELNMGTTTNISAAKLETPVMEVINLMIQKSISSVPIVDEQDKLINAYEAVDVLTLIKGGLYADLTLSVGEALLKRSEDFEGVYTCTLNDSVFAISETIRKARVHRLFIVDDDGKLLGVLTLSDILRYILFS
ncbi:AMP-activated serine/threonine-protein kinase regulatory subunit [Brettanomyces nanus]|uniref:5'-AMP-activated protein kinase subunit gamma n=1 Tax=Eeniella nana TaxID=13502 RepID=A0A875S4L2_EENNA|nr:AMP-activated serine/threonine-protein kinase regulatory subunit [Brettanomyces nanus]QPG76246.1 AMP-activated serine/threonine-protein kinase regulatory subunit [Brettanomyces nanus]